MSMGVALGIMAGTSVVVVMGVLGIVAFGFSKGASVDVVVDAVVGVGASLGIGIVWIALLCWCCDKMYLPACGFLFAYPLAL